MQQERLMPVNEVDVESEPLGLRQQQGRWDRSREVVRGGAQVCQSRIDPMPERELLCDATRPLDVVSQSGGQVSQTRLNRFRKDNVTLSRAVAAVRCGCRLALL